MTDNREIDLVDALLFVWKRKIIILVVTILGFSATFALWNYRLGRIVVTEVPLELLPIPHGVKQSEIRLFMQGQLETVTGATLFVESLATHSENVSGQMGAMDLGPKSFVGKHPRVKMVFEPNGAPSLYLFTITGPLKMPEEGAGELIAKALNNVIINSRRLPGVAIDTENEDTIGLHQLVVQIQREMYSLKAELDRKAQSVGIDVSRFDEATMNMSLLEQILHMATQVAANGGLTPEELDSIGRQAATLDEKLIYTRGSGVGDPNYVERSIRAMLASKFEKVTAPEGVYALNNPVQKISTRVFVLASFVGWLFIGLLIAGAVEFIRHNYGRFSDS